MRKQSRKGGTGKKFVDAHFAKSGMYRNVLKDVGKANVCPFCPATMKWHTNPVLKVRGGWRITESFQPYKNTAHHFLIIGTKHKEQIEELTKKDWGEISWLQRWAVKKYAIVGGGVAMRFGDAAHTGATVRHLHLHLIEPRLVRGKAVPVYFPVG